jgi:glycosyltransferase involved in cell wall biosynthesis
VSPPSCSVVIPTHERPEQLRECLETLTRIDSPEGRYEVIVVADGGTTPLDPIVAGFQDRIEVQLVVQEQAGPAAARNTGAARAQGEILAFTDDDCRPRPDWLRQLGAAAAASPGAAVGGRTVNAFPENVYSAAAQLIVDVNYRKSTLGPPEWRWFATNNLAVPADGFRDVGGFDVSYTTAEDRDFCSRWTARGHELTFEPLAIVEHGRDLSLSQYTAMHFRYGRGAYRYHRGQARRPNRSPLVERSYYVSLAREPFRREPPLRALRLHALLGVWHVANTAGFGYEWAQARRYARLPSL